MRRSGLRRVRAFSAGRLAVVRGSGAAEARRQGTRVGAVGSHAQSAQLSTSSVSASRTVRNIVCVSKLTKLEEIRRGLASPAVARINNASKQCIESDAEHAECVLAIRKALAELPELRVRWTEGLREADADWAHAVVSIGGDGTFLRCARRLSEDSETAIVGINSSPKSSFGFFCAANASTTPALFRALVDGTAPVTPLWRAKALIDGNPLPSLFLNEALYTSDCPAVTSRYIVSSGAAHQGQHSSGIWISTAAGSTGAIYSAGGEVMPLSARQLQFRVRELFPLNLRGATPITGGRFASADDFAIVSRTIGGALYLDGRFKPEPVPFGSKVTFESTKKPLRWIAPQNQEKRVSDNWAILTGKPRPMS